MAEADAAAEMAQIYLVPSLLLPTPPLAGFTHST
jgi:hypothetical protein